MPEDRSREKSKDKKSGFPIRFEITILQRDATGNPVGSSHSFADGRSATAYPSSDNQMDIDIEGQPARGESTTGSACKELFDHLKTIDVNWERYVTVADQGSKKEYGVDCCIEHSSGRRLDIQVTRAVNSQWYRHSIAKEKKLTASFETGALVDELRCAIDHKKLLPQANRQPMALVLDATETPQCATVPVAESFRDQFSNWTRNLGFQAVWVVGRSVDLVFRLDSAEKFYFEEASKGKC